MNRNSAARTGLLALLAIVMVQSGCAQFNELPLGPTEYQDQPVSSLSAPLTAKTGQPVAVNVELYFPGGNCWEHDRIGVMVNEAEHRVTIRPLMRFTPTYNDRVNGRGCIDETRHVTAMFTPPSAGTYVVEADSSSGSVVTAHVQVSD
jgi:hypothetical protein